MNGVDFDGITTIPMDGKNGSDPDCFPSQPRMNVATGTRRVRSALVLLYFRGAEILKFSGDWNRLSQTTARHYGISVTGNQLGQWRAKDSGSFCPTGGHFTPQQMPCSLSSQTTTRPMSVCSWHGVSTQGLRWASTLPTGCIWCLVLSCLSILPILSIKCRPVPSE